MCYYALPVITLEMTIMLDALLHLIPPMLLGTQLILTLILVKGEICPGQRGRLHKLFPVIGTLWLASASTTIVSLAVVMPIFYFYSQVQTGKTRNSGPLWLLYLADIAAVAVVALQVLGAPSLWTLLTTLFTTAFLGTAFAHLNLKFARSRLQAFHSLLPLGGLLTGIALVVTVSVQALQLNEALLESLSINIFAGLALLIAGILVWCLHLLRGIEVQKVQLSVAMLFVLAATMSLQPLMVA